MSQQKYFHFTVEGSLTEIIAAIDENNVTTVISYKNGFRNDNSYDFEDRKKKGYEKGVLKHHEFSMADVLIPQIVKYGKTIDKIEPHDLLTIIEYRTKVKEKQKENSIKTISEKNVEDIIVNETSIEEEYNGQDIITISDDEIIDDMEDDLSYKNFDYDEVVIDEIAESDLECNLEDIEPTMVLNKQETNSITENHEKDFDVIIDSSDDIVILPKYYFFSKPSHCFHPSYPAVFNFRNKTFISVNHFMTYSKAMIAEDEDAIFKIMEYNNSNTMARGLIEGIITGQEIIKETSQYNKWKAIDAEINNINKNITNKLMIWEEKRIAIMTVAIREKCNQNKDIKKTLTDTKEQKIVFAVQNAILGAGIKEKEITQESNWFGINELGKIFDKLK